MRASKAQSFEIVEKCCGGRYGSKIFPTIRKFLVLGSSRGNQKEDLPDRTKELPRRAPVPRKFEVVSKCMMKARL